MTARSAFWLALLALSVAAAPAAAPVIAPATEASARKSVKVDLAREGQEPLAVRVSWPTQGEGPFPVVVWSHGLMGSRDGYRPLGEAWVPEGFVVLQPTHPDSRAVTPVQDLDLATVAKSAAQRPRDVRDVLDHLDALLTSAGADPKIADHERIGVGGHSFGAHTAMMVGGMTAKHPITGELVEGRDERADAILAISPQGPATGRDTDAYRSVTPPILMVTGSKDESPVSDRGPEWRLKAWEGLTPGPDRWLLYLEGATHGFGGITGVGWKGAGESDAAILGAVIEVTTAFWKATLLGDAEARRFLDSEALKRRTHGDARIERRTK